MALVKDSPIAEPAKQLSLFFKKLKRLNPIEPSLGLLGFFLLSALFLATFVCFDYDTVLTGLRSGGDWLGLRNSTSLSIISPFPPPPPSWRPSPSISPAPSPSIWLAPSSSISPAPSPSISPAPRPGYLDEGGERCDVYDGKWVWDEEYPLYKSIECPFMDGGFACKEGHRPDSSYTKWRWQPNHCDLPRFNASRMAEQLRNKRVVFAGDSLGRNQWESFMCMVTAAIPDKASIREARGQPLSKHSGSMVFKIPGYNCSVEYYRSTFLVPQAHPPPGSPKEVRLTLRLDTMDWTSPLWRSADILVLNTGHWWSPEKTIRQGCYFQVGRKVRQNMTVEAAYRKSLDTVVNWIANQVDTDKTDVFIRTYSPVHFRGGNWNSGGGCHTETQPEEEEDRVREFGGKGVHYKGLEDIMGRHVKDIRVGKVEVLDVTEMTRRRKDGHPSVYYLGEKGPAPLHHQDCSHWCLPGVPDIWNELLFALLLKRHA